MRDHFDAAASVAALFFLRQIQLKLRIFGACKCLAISPLALFLPISL